jgi:hypothetical protein
MSIPIPDDVDSLISELTASLQPQQHAAFEAAARSALAGLECAGPGLAYRLLVPLQRAHFDPPDDAVEAHAPRHYRRPTKLSSLPPIGRPDRAEGAQERNRFKRAG